MTYNKEHGTVQAYSIEFLDGARNVSVCIYFCAEINNALPK